MSRVVNVSNRVALPDGSIPTGGLAHVIGRDGISYATMFSMRQPNGLHF